MKLVAMEFNIILKLVFFLIQANCMMEFKFLSLNRGMKNKICVYVTWLLWKNNWLLWKMISQKTTLI